MTDVQNGRIITPVYTITYNPATVKKATDNTRCYGSSDNSPLICAEGVDPTMPNAFNTQYQAYTVSPANSFTIDESSGKRIPIIEPDDTLAGNFMVLNSLFNTEGSDPFATVIFSKDASDYQGDQNQDVNINKSLGTNLRQRGKQQPEEANYKCR